MPVSDNLKRVQFAPWIAPLSVLEEKLVAGEAAISSDDNLWYYKPKIIDSNGQVIDSDLISIGSAGGGVGGSGIIVGNEAYLLSNLQDNQVGILTETNTTTNSTYYTVVIKKVSSLIPVSADTIPQDANTPNGPLILGTDGKISISLLPASVITLDINGKISDQYISNTFINEVWAISGSSNLISLVAAKKSDFACVANGATYILKDLPPTNVNNWIKIAEAPSSNNYPVGTVYTGSASTLSNLTTLPSVSGIQQVNQLSVLVEQSNTLRAVIRTLEGFLPIGVRWVDILNKPSSMAELGVSDYISSTAKGIANGLATLDGSGKIPLSQMPPQSIGDVFPVNTLADLNTLTQSSQGDFAYVSEDQSLHIKDNIGVWRQVGVGSVAFDIIVSKPNTVEGYGIINAAKTYTNKLYTEILPDILREIYNDGYVKDKIQSFPTAGTFEMKLGTINYVKTNGVVLTFPVALAQSQVINASPYTPANRAITEGDWAVVKLAASINSTISSANTKIEGQTENVVLDNQLPVKFVYSGSATGWIIA